MATPQAIQGAGTVTLGASGGADTIGYIQPARSNEAFRDLTITIVPLEDPSPYKVEVYHDGELVETHTFSEATDRVVCHLSFPNKIFPANIGTNAISKYFQSDRKNFYGVPIRIMIENLMGSRASFIVYATAETLTTQFYEITQE
jgi:hypothetical protein